MVQNFVSVGGPAIRRSSGIRESVNLGAGPLGPIFLTACTQFRFLDWNRVDYSFILHYLVFDPAMFAQCCGLAYSVEHEYLYLI